MASWLLLNLLQAKNGVNCVDINLKDQLEKLSKRLDELAKKFEEDTEIIFTDIDDLSGRIDQLEQKMVHTTIPKNYIFFTKISVDFRKHYRCSIVAERNWTILHGEFLPRAFFIWSEWDRIVLHKQQRSKNGSPLQLWKALYRSLRTGLWHTFLHGFEARVEPDQQHDDPSQVFIHGQDGSNQKLDWFVALLFPNL